MKKFIVIALGLFSVSLLAEDIEMEDLVLQDIETPRVIDSLAQARDTWLSLDANYKIKEGHETDGKYMLVCNDLAFRVNGKPVEIGMPLLRFTDSIQKCSIIQLRKKGHYEWEHWLDEQYFPVKIDTEKLKPAIDNQIKEYMGKKYPTYEQYFDYTITAGNGQETDYKLLDIVRYTLLLSNIQRDFVLDPPHFTRYENKIILTINMQLIYIDFIFVPVKDKKIVKLIATKNTSDGLTTETNDLYLLNKLFEKLSMWPEYVASPLGRD